MSCPNIHLFTTALYIINIKKKRPDIKEVKAVMIPEKETGLNKLKSIVNGKNMDTKKKEKKTNFVASINSTGKML